MLMTDVLCYLFIFFYRNNCKGYEGIQKTEPTKIPLKKGFSTK